MSGISLSSAQSQVVEHGDGALLVVAGPGSGKTRVLVERIRRLLSMPGHFRVLAITFTNKAANEMADRLESAEGVRNRSFIGTFHSFCTEVLANRGKSVGISGLPHIFESYQDRKQVLQASVSADPLLRKALQGVGDDARQQSQMLDRWLQAISDAKNNLMSSDSVTDPIVQAAYIAYDAGLRASNAVDFDDLLLLTYRLFEERPQVADFYRRQYRYICIDEAQDLNDAQYRVLCALCGKAFFNIMMVGDPKQAIFMWNGAHPKYMSLFEQDFSARRIVLTDNFRSSRAVVKAAQALVDDYTVEGQLPVAGLAALKACDDEHGEADFIVDHIRSLIVNGHPDVEGAIAPSRIAVLGRNRFVFREVEEALAAAKMPFYKNLSSAAQHSESDTVEEFELALRVLANPLDRLHLGMLASKWSSGSLEEIYSHEPLRGIAGHSLLAKLAAQCSTQRCGVVMKAIAALEWDGTTFRFAKSLDALAESANALVDEEERAAVLQDIAEWRKHWDMFVRSDIGGQRNILTFLSQVALGGTQQPTGDGVALLTVHSAKGMEFDVVFVAGMCEGTFPDFRAKGSGLDEEMRNAFVAVTRSRRLLYCTYPREKTMPWGDVKRQQPSRFIGLMLQAKALEVFS